MTPPLDWTHFDLVIFDVDGTLYDQRRLRTAMLRLLMADALRHRSLSTIRLLRSFRQVREDLGDRPEPDFLQLQYLRTAERHGSTPDRVRRITTEWMEQRPLRWLGACRYPHLDAVFAGLRAAGKQIAVCSDYPARDKLEALGLHADPIVCATDADIARLKPDPTGLKIILERTGVRPDRALMIGDRFDRDAEAAEQAGMRALIRSRQPHVRHATFRSYADAVFQPLLQAAARPPVGA